MGSRVNLAQLIKEHKFERKVDHKLEEAKPEAPQWKQQGGENLDSTKRKGENQQKTEGKSCRWMHIRDMTKKSTCKSPGYHNSKGTTRMNPTM